VQTSAIGMTSYIREGKQVLAQINSVMPIGKTPRIQCADNAL
jgi:hypothetical protein